jgi:hypothetical protein
VAGLAIRQIAVRVAFPSLLQIVTNIHVLHEWRASQSIIAAPLTLSIHQEEPMNLPMIDASRDGRITLDGLRAAAAKFGR